MSRGQPHPEAGAFEEPGGLDLRAAWDGIRKHRWLVLAVAAVVTIVVGLYSLRLPKVYSAEATLEFDPNPPRPLGEEVADPTSPGNYWMSKEWLRTQQRIIASRHVAEEVVREIGLHKDPSFFRIPKDERAGWEGTTVETAAQILRGLISVEPIEETRLVRVQVMSAAPDRAAMLANAVAKAYIDKTQRDRMGSTHAALDWLSSQLDNLSQELNEAELKLHEFKEENNVLSLALEDRINVIASDIQQISQVLTQARTRRIDLEARLGALKKLQDRNPMAANVAMTDQNPALAKLREELRAATAMRGELAPRYGQNHPVMEALDAKIATTSGQMQEEIHSMLDALQGELEKVASEELGLAAALEDVNQRALELNLQEIEYARLHRQRDNKAKLQGVLLERTAETNLTRMLHVENVRILDRALPPNHAIKPNVRKNVAFGSLGGLMLGLLLAVGLGYLDRTVKGEADLDAMGLGFLGIIPTMGEKAERASPYSFRRKRAARRDEPTKDGKPAADDLLVHHKPMSSAAECARVIRTNLTFMAADRQLRTLLVTSSRPQEGKTTIAVNLAVVIAQTGRRVLLIDTDLRRPRLHRVFGTTLETGVTTYLVSNVALQEVTQPTDVPNLWFIPSGPIPPNPSELLHTERFGSFSATVAAEYDTVIFDSPPLGPVTDAAIIAARVDGTVLVARAGTTTKDVLRASAQQLRGVGSRLLGCVLNAVDLERHGNRYSYYRGAGYYYASDEERREGGKKRDAEAA
jgi:polysaccharide biosynthesis transport protein